MTSALVIGKFWPPHRGHEAMIQHAHEIADMVYVMVCSTPTARPSGDQRSLWIQSMFPRSEVILVDDFCDWHFPVMCPPECTPKWAKRTREVINSHIDFFVASEEYGLRFSRALGAEYFEFDFERQKFPVSGSEVRADIAGNWDRLPNMVRAGLIRRISVMGAESTGTTTLANDLAIALGTLCVPEVGRTVSWELMAREGSMEDVTWDAQVFWRILNTHASLEEQARIRRSLDAFGPMGAWIVSDTDALATVTWWRRYLGHPPDDVIHFARERLADAYIITSPEDVPFDQDGLRDGEHLRDQMHAEFLGSAIDAGRATLVVQGSRSDRVGQALDFLADVSRDFPLFQR